jgi:hypothetical protein
MFVVLGCDGLGNVDRSATATGVSHEEGWVANEKSEVVLSGPTSSMKRRRRCRFYSAGRHEGASEGFWNPVAYFHLDIVGEINWTAIRMR